MIRSDDVIDSCDASSSENVISTVSRIKAVTVLSVAAFICYGFHGEVRLLS